MSRIKRYVYFTCQHGVYKQVVYRQDNSRMHESVKRLLDCARLAISQSPNPVTSFKDLASRLGESSATMTNWKTRGVSKEGAIKAEREFGCTADFILKGAGGPVSQALFAAEQSTGRYSLMVPKMPLSWMELESMARLPGYFETLLADDAMSPDIPAGRKAEFSTTEAPRFGDHVLVRDRERKLHFRLYAQVPGGWISKASNPAFMDLMPERDGAVVAAVMMAHSVPRRSP